ncbi:non-ribosomal peptide synthetase [Clostridium estertheticum]|uniref:non-ribosomal peptide synthetase n=1 Tax=Clostridium estertheticum TaxID=238834 RepID=UPI001C0ADB3F|nr:non-ribosomal peptide synthetase [Clostridium estertheticum]MBU3186314.1 amino acid adenylation domain-containing protein [Clostridium estertheticum]
MMKNKKVNVKELINSFFKKGITLWEEDGKLRYRSPQGVINREDLQAMKEYKIDILNLLQEEKRELIVEAYPESKYEQFPLTDIQSAYLLGRSDVFGYGGVACHIYLEINYDSLDHKRSEAIWNQLVLRHDMLRSTINKNGYQQVLEKVLNLNVPYYDITGLEEEIEKQLNLIRADMGHRVYDTENWPLFSVAITKTPNNAILHFSIEFLIADWASIWLLLSEFEELYYNPGKELSNLNLTFRDYLIAEKRLKESITYYNDKEYWMKRIDTIPAAPKLPIANIEKSEGQVQFNRYTILMDDKKWSQFKEKAKKYGVTPTVAVMSAYASVIERWSSNNKFCLNLTVLNRLSLHQQVNDIVGDFTSISLLGIDWQYKNSFSKNAKKIIVQLFDDLDHRLFSGVEVLREISRRSGREAALMPIVFTSAIGLIKSSQGSQLKGRISEHGISQTPQVFIDCQAMDTKLGLQVNWDVREGVFLEGMIKDMFNAFEALLISLSSEDKQWEKEENIDLPEWQIKQREEMNNTKKSLPKHLLHSGILKQIDINPEKIAVIDSNEAVTYKDLALRASSVVEKLKEVGCNKQDKVAIIMDKSVYQVECVLGVLSVGGVYVPIDIMQPETRRTEMLKKTNTKFVLTSSTLEINLPEDIKRIDVDKLNPYCRNILVDDGEADMPSYIIHTSGSTGHPKGVVITHEAAVNTIEDINERFNIGCNDKVLGLAQLSFDLSVYDIFGMLSAGGTLIYPSVERQTDPSHWVDLMVKHGVTIWNSVPALMQMLVTYLNSEEHVGLPQLRISMLSGDWIPLNLPDMLIKKAPAVKIISLGGATEASIWSIFYEYKGLKNEWKSIPYGKPLSNQGFHVLDEKMRDCPVWVPGELFISGEGLAKEYYENKDITESSFIYHPIRGQRLYRTGDMGRYTKDDEIEFLGRQDNQVKIKGHRIELGEIEAALQKHPSVETAAVVVEGKDDDRSLFAVVETSNRKQYRKDDEKEKFERLISDLNIEKDERWNSEVLELQVICIIDSIAALVKNIEKEIRGETLRVLILGSSIGKNTEILLKNLEGSNIEYLLTDETEDSMNGSKSGFEKFSNTEFTVFDVNKDYRGQGISPNDFHVVISNFSLSEVEDVSAVGKRLLEILRPHGWFLMLEATNINGKKYISKIINRKEQDINKMNRYMDKDKFVRFMKEQGEESMLWLPRDSKEDCCSIELMVCKVKQNKEGVGISKLIEFISNRLPNHMIPNSIQVVDALPLTINDKINRKELVTWKVKPRAGSYDFKKRSSLSEPLEKLLSQIWSEALDINYIGETQSFYNCGADSLIMAQVTGKLREALSKSPYTIDIKFDVLLRNMLNNPTISELAEFIHSKETKTEKLCNKGKGEECDKDSSNASLIFYGHQGGKTLRVVFHEGLGSMSCFKFLIPHLINQDAGSILGINIDNADVYSSLDSETLIETIAEDYANRLIKTGCKDMQFIGYSLGGIIAVEVARRIVESGVNLTDLVIIDPHHIPLTIEDELILEILFISNLNLTLKRVGFNGVNEGEMLKGLVEIIETNGEKVPSGASLTIGGDEELNKVGEFFIEISKISQKERFIKYAEAASTYNEEKMPLEMIERLFKIFCQSYKAAQFKPMPYFGDIRIFLSKEPFDLLPEVNHMTHEFWKEICLGDLSVKEIKGNHFTCIATEPNARDLAKEISAVVIR